MKYQPDLNDKEKKNDICKNEENGDSQNEKNHSPERKRKGWLWTIIVVLVVVTIGFCAWFFCPRNGPEKELNAAIMATREKQQEFLGKSGNLKDLAKFVSDHNNLGKISFSAEGGFYTTQLEMTSAFDKKKNIARIDVNCNQGTGENSIQNKMQVSIDENELQVALPNLNDKVFAIPLEELNINEEWMENFLPQNEKSRAEELRVTGTTEETLLLGDTKEECRIYTVKADENLIAYFRKFAFGISPKMSTLGNLKMENIRFAVSNNFVRGVFLDVKIGDNTEAVKVLFIGKENPMSHICLHIDNKMEIEFLVDRMEKGLSANALVNDEEKMRISYDDDARTFRLNTEKAETQICYEVKDGKAEFQIVDNFGNVRISIEPNLQGKAEKLSENAVDITWEEAQQMILGGYPVFAMQPEIP